MSVSNAYRLWAVKLPGAAGLLEGISNQEFDPGEQEYVSASDGSLDPTHVSVMEIAPMLRWGVLDLAVALGAAGIDGLAVAGASGAGLYQYWRKTAAEGGLGSGSVNLSLEMVKGMIIPVELIARQNQEAVLTMEANAVWDGTNDPIIFAANVAAPATGVISKRYTLGPVSINGVLLNGAIETRLAFGLELYRRSGDGDVFITRVGIKARRPMITVRCLETKAEVFGLLGTAQGATDSLFYFRKKAAGGGNVANNVAEHVKASVAAGRISVRSLSSTKDDEAESEIQIRPVWNGTDAIVALNVASAIA